MGVVLIAIVGLRVEVLKLGSGVGTEIQQATTLQSANAALRARISALSDNQRIATLAGDYGMRMPNPLDVHFVQATVGSHVAAAIHNISVPSNSAFLTGLATEQQANQQSNQAVAAMNGAATNTGAGTAPSAGATSPASGTTSTGTGSVSSTTSGATDSQATTGVTSSTGLSATSTAGTTPPASTAGGSSSDGATAGVTTGGSTGSDPSTSQATLSTGSTDGGSGLGG